MAEVRKRAERREKSERRERRSKAASPSPKISSLSDRAGPSVEPQSLGPAPTYSDWTDSPYLSKILQQEGDVLQNVNTRPGSPNSTFPVAPLSESDTVVTRKAGVEPDIGYSTQSPRQVLQNEIEQMSFRGTLSTPTYGIIKTACAALLLPVDRLCLAMGYLEPPLEEGWTRIRSQCCCGDHFYDDIYEQAEGGIATLIRQMFNSTANISITAVSYSSRSTNQRYSFRTPTWVRTLVHNLLTAFLWRNHHSKTLPCHNAGNLGPMTSGTNPGNHPQQQSTLYLMSCVHRSRDHTILLQDDLGPIDNDRALFSFLKNRTRRRRSRLLQVLSCRSIEGIYFSKVRMQTYPIFRLYLDNSVEVRHHDPCCRSKSPSICECIPPDYKLVPSDIAEYSCRKPNPAGTWSLVGPKHLAHMLKCPLQINDKGTWVFDLVPKRNWGELSSRPDEPTEGWGFYFEEGWDFDIVANIAFFVFMLGSLLFGILWTVLKSDIQGAFGVSSYIVTLSGLIIAVVVRQAGKRE
ncbi:transcription factor c2h2 [Pyrenophora seminiperda CCB06]|uniref:Transcription factor c2h2 n=1 Tax=Pyrenophora seminiperda CCB06 TaxID=1302712 RepID=A0A3M7MIW1_9PLEO|nr:transcription factor c2h2 [Pyrenophora seminiperda CCB06]